MSAAFEQVQQAWELCSQAGEYARKAAYPANQHEVIEKIFKNSPLVDWNRTNKESSGNPNPHKIYLKSPYGLEFNSQTKNWIPFRHGEVKF
jgi:hypothetical protein